MSSRPSPFILEFYAECKPVNSCKFAKLDEASCGQKKGKLYKTLKALILSITLTTERSQSIANRGHQRKRRETCSRVTFGAKCINRKPSTDLSCRFEVYLAIETISEESILGKTHHCHFTLLMAKFPQNTD